MRNRDLLADVLVVLATEGRAQRLLLSGTVCVFLDEVGTTGT